MVDFYDLSGPITELKLDEAKVKRQRAEWKRLRRGLIKPATDRETAVKLRTNDPETYFDLALHLLSSRPIRWEMRSVPQDTEQEQREYGIAERMLDSAIELNDVRRSRKGQQRAHRSITDAALEQGKVAVFHERIEGDRGTEFHIDPVDPSQVYERFDDRGIAEFVREYEVSATWLENKAREAGWQLPEGGVKGNILMWDYWRALPMGKYRNVINVGQKAGNTFGRVSSVNTVRDEIVDRIPWHVQYFNGEANAVNSIEKGRSILEINSRLYDEKHKYLEKLDIHLNEVLTSPGNAGSVGARPVVDKRLLSANEGERGVHYFDPSRGESALSFSQIPPIDSSTQLLLSSTDQGIQNGGVAQFFLGQIKQEFSGVALKRLEELTLAAVGEVGVGLSFLWSQLGRWILESIRDEGYSGHADWVYDEEITLPEYLSVRAIVEVALPDDLTERISQARQAAPSSGDIWPKRVINEVFFSREIPDARGIADELDEQETAQLPEMRLIRTYGALLRHKQKWERSPNSEDKELALEIITKELSLIERAFTGTNAGNRTGRAEEPVSGSFPQNVQPTEARFG